MELTLISICACRRTVKTMDSVKLSAYVITSPAVEPSMEPTCIVETHASDPRWPRTTSPQKYTQAHPKMQKQITHVSSTKHKTCARKQQQQRCLQSAHICRAHIYADAENTRGREWTIVSLTTRRRGEEGAGTPGRADPKTAAALEPGNINIPLFVCIQPPRVLTAKKYQW